VIVEAVNDVPAHVEVEGVLGCLVQQVSGLHQLRPEKTGLIFKAVLCTRNRIQEGKNGTQKLENEENFMF
jgi:hypothetical protein